MRAAALGFAALLTTISLAACTLDTLTLPTANASLEVRGILIAGQPVQRIILSRVFSASATIGEGGATAVSGAVVTVTSPTGHLFVGREVLDTVVDPVSGLAMVTSDSARGYEFTSTGADALIPGSTYRLRVTTPAGDTVTGSTQMPPGGANGIPLVHAFNRDHDTLSLSWTTRPGAVSYTFQADGPSGSFSEFLSGTSIRLSGDLKSLALGQNPTLVFAPGFSVSVTVAAVDQHYSDYFRAANDPFAGLGRVDGLVGAYGVFGSVAPIILDSLEVTADLTDLAIEGHWRLADNSSALVTARATDFWLYPDASALPVPGSTMIAGSYLRPGMAKRLVATGSRLGAAVTLRMIRAHLLENVMHATVRGDTLTATYDTDGAAAVFIRAAGGG